MKHRAEYWPPPDTSELVNRTVLAQMLGCSRKKTYRLEALDDSFPKPARDACGTEQWKRRDVLEYIDGMFAQPGGADA